MEIIEKQNEIIRIQSEAIDDLFRMLIQHITVEEADKLPALEKMNHAAELRKELRESNNTGGSALCAWD